MAQYIVYKVSSKGGYGSSGRNADRLKRYDSLSEARAQAIRQWKKIGDTSIDYAIEKVTANADNPWNHHTYDFIGWVRADWDGTKFRYYYLTWTRDMGRNGRFKTDMHKRPAKIEIAENGQTIKSSINPNIVSRYNRKKKEQHPFGL